MTSTSEPQSQVAAPPPGTIIAGKYRVEHVLGSGGMGVVVAATHIQLDERVALKFLSGPGARSGDHVERFLREARASVRIRSQHVVRVFDVGTLENGEPFMVMELLHGLDLHRLSRERGPLPVAEAIDYVSQACGALAEAHGLGIVHRDLKPANLFLTRRADGTPLVKVLDFGISKILDGADQGLTGTSDILGSPLYMSPEQIRDARAVDGRSDIWSLGNILFKLLTGRVPFAADSSSGTLAKIIADPAPSLRASRPDVPPELDAIVHACLEKQVERRFQRVEDLALALASVGRGAPFPPPSGTPEPSAHGGSATPPATTPEPSRTVALDAHHAAWAPAAPSPPMPTMPTLVAETTATGSAVSTARAAPRGSRVALSVGLAVAIVAGGALAVVGLMLLRGPRESPAASAPSRDTSAAPDIPTPASATLPAVSAPAASAAAPEATAAPAEPAVSAVSAVSAAPPAVPRAPRRATPTVAPANAKKQGRGPLVRTYDP